MERDWENFLLPYEEAVKELKLKFRTLRSQFEKEGFQVECLLKGLGENETIRQIFIDHIEEARKGEA